MNNEFNNGDWGLKNVNLIFKNNYRLNLKINER